MLASWTVWYTQRSMSVSSHAHELFGSCHFCEDASAEVFFVRKRGSVELVHVSCETCHRAFLAVVVEEGDLVSSIGFATDLLPEDCETGCLTAPVSLDDVLAAHEALHRSGSLRASR